MANPQRIERIQSRIRQDIAELFLSELKDPRIKGLLSITRVKVSTDLSHAHIYWSVLGSDGDQRTTERAIEDARSLIQTKVGKGLNIRVFPQLTFHHDDSIEKQVEVSKLIDQALEADKPHTDE